jgi:hypothetical protein
LPCGYIRAKCHRTTRRVAPPDTLTARANLASWTGEAGDPAAARVQFAAMLPVIERVLGAEYPSTLAARANFARWTTRADRPPNNEDHPGT